MIVGELYRSRVLDGSWTPDMAEQLLSGSSNPDGVMAEFKEQNKDPEVRAALRKLLGRRGVTRVDRAQWFMRGLLWRRDAADEDLDIDPDDDLTADERLEAAALVEEFGAIDDDDETRTDDDPAQRLDAAGYNPNRHPDGRFAPGPHAKAGASAVSRAAQRVTRAGELRDVHAGRLAEAKISKREAVAEARGLLKEARAAAVVARKTPTAANKRAAQVAANRAARATRRVDKHKELVAKHTEAHTKAKDAHIDAKAALREARSGIKRPTLRDPEAVPVTHSAEPPGNPRIRKIVADDTGRVVVAHGIVDLVRDGPHDSGLNARQLSHEAQGALREHHNKVLSAYGLYDRDHGLMHARTVEVRTAEGMGDGARGAHWLSTGKVALETDRAQSMVEHSALDDGGLRRLGSHYMDKSVEARGLVLGYLTSTHEAVHGYGPNVARSGPRGSHRTMLEETTTEMVARKVTSDVHGIPIDRLAAGYSGYINPTVNEMVALSGKSYGPSSFTDAHEALAHASLVFKRKSEDDLSPTDGLQELSRNALLKLGVSDQESHRKLYDRMIEISNRGPQ